MSNDIDDLEMLDELEALTSDEPKPEPEPKQKAEPEPKPEPKPEPEPKQDAELKDGEMVIVNPLEGETNLRDILAFDDLDIAVKEQASLFAYYSEAAARAHKQYSRAKQNLEHVEATVAHVLRKSWDAGELGKLTEKALEGRVRLSKPYQRAQECLNDAQYIHKLCTNIVEAFHQREQMIIQTCKRAELEIKSVTGFRATADRETRDDRVREAMKKRSTAR